MVDFDPWHDHDPRMAISDDDSETHIRRYNRGVAFCGTELKRNVRDTKARVDGNFCRMCLVTLAGYHHDTAVTEPRYNALKVMYKTHYVDS